MLDLTNINLLQQNCKHYTPNDPTLTTADIKELMNAVIDWGVTTNQTVLTKKFSFKNYYQTISFVNAVAWIVHQQNHHPEITINYNSCSIQFSTHSINALSLNDFICAARIDAIETLND